MSRDRAIRTTGACACHWKRGASRLTVLVLVAAMHRPSAGAQDVAHATPHHTVVPTIEARPEDVRSIDNIIKTSYETISGPAGQPRQWGRDRTLYIPNVYYVQTGVDPKTGKVISHGMTYQEYADSAGPDLEKYGYFEREIGRTLSVFGHVASAMSAWEARTEANGRVIGRGVNSIQLVNDGKRWWITSINWDEETKDNPIPGDLLISGMNSAH